jgi:hypothetical protein
MLRIVLPGVAAARGQSAGAVSVAPIDVPGVDVRLVVVAYVIVVDVDVDVAVAPPGIIAQPPR